MNWPSQPNSNGILCCHCNDGTTIPLENVSYTFNRNKNAVNKIMLKGHCNKIHASHICPFCFSTFNNIRASKICFENHIRNNITVCPQTCDRKCKTLEEWMVKHGHDDPNFRMEKKLTKKQQIRCIREGIADGSMESVSYDVVELRETLVDHSDAHSIQTYLENSGWSECDEGDGASLVIDDSLTHNDVIRASVLASMDHHLTCNSACTDIQHLKQPLQRQSSFHPWKSHNQMHFTINHYINGGLSDTKIDSLLHDLHFQYSTHTLDIPLSLIEMKNCIKQIPKLSVRRASEGSKTPIFSMNEVIANVLADEELVSHMEFGIPQCVDGLVSEVHQSPKWKLIVEDMNKSRPGALPLIILLFYDDFRKFRLDPSSCGGLYMAVLNFDQFITFCMMHICVLCSNRCCSLRSLPHAPVFRYLQSHWWN